MLIDVPLHGDGCRGVPPDGARRRRALQAAPLIAVLLCVAALACGPLAGPLALAADAVARGIGVHRHRHRVKEEWKELQASSELYNSTTAADHDALAPKHASGEEEHPAAPQKKPKPGHDPGFELNEMDSWSLGCTKNYANCGR
jgi:hypothetical protein